MRGNAVLERVPVPVKEKVAEFVSEAESHSGGAIGAMSIDVEIDVKAMRATFQQAVEVVFVVAETEGET